MEIITRSVPLACGENINVRYIIKENERKVIAITDDKDYTSELLINFLHKKFDNFGIIILFKDSVYRQLVLNETYKAVATCNELDEWDVNKGIEVAKMKLKVKLDKAINNRLAYFIDRNNKVLRSLYGYQIIRELPVFDDK